MARIRLITVLFLLMAATVPPAGASVTTRPGVIPLQLTGAETSYLGVQLPCFGPRQGQDARLPVTNDGSNRGRWDSSIPLQVLATRVVGSLIEVLVVPLGFNLIGPQTWTDSCGDFTYVVRLNPNASQPQSLLYFATDAQGVPSFFAGTLYVAAVLRMTDLATGAVSEQELSLALNVDGRWVDEPAASLLDGDLSSILPFTEHDASGQLKDDYTCVNETHSLGYYCLQTSSALLSELGGS